ncbi:hypothetical protein MTO96_016405 [Rhipicephalus appendiculatus]
MLKKIVSLKPAYSSFLYVRRPPSIDFSVANLCCRTSALTYACYTWPRFESLSCVNFTPEDISYSAKGGSNISTTLPAGFSLNVPRARRKSRCLLEQATWSFFVVSLRGTLAWLFDVCGRCHHLELTVSRVVTTSNRRWSPVSGA